MSRKNEKAGTIFSPRLYYLELFPRQPIAPVVPMKNECWSSFSTDEPRESSAYIN